MNNIKLQECFSTSLKHYRYEKKLSQFELAEKAGVIDKYISDLERQIYSPRLEMIETLASALEIKAIELLSDKFYEEVNNSSLKIDSVRKKQKRKKLVSLF